MTSESSLDDSADVHYPVIHFENSDSDESMSITYELGDDEAYECYEFDLGRCRSRPWTTGGVNSEETPGGAV